jgi:hypothetical protein
MLLTAAGYALQSVIGSLLMLERYVNTYTLMGQVSGTAAANGPFVQPPDHIWVNMQQRWNDTDKDSEKILSQCHFIYHRSHLALLSLLQGCLDADIIMGKVNELLSFRWACIKRKVSCGLVSVCLSVRSFVCQSIRKFVWLCMPHCSTLVHSKCK